MNLLSVRNYPKVAFWNFSQWGLWTFVPLRTAYAKKSRICSEATHCRLLSLLEYHISPLGFQYGLLFCHDSQQRFFSVHIHEQQMKLQLLGTVVTLPPRPLCVLGALGTRLTRCLQRSFLHFCPQGPSTLFGRTLSCTFVKALLVFPNANCWPTGGDWSKFLHPFSRERPSLNGTSELKLCKTQWVTVDPTNLCPSCTCAHLCAGRKYSWFTVGCYNAVGAGAFCYHLHQHHYVNQSHPSIPQHRIFPTSHLSHSLKSPKRIVSSSALTLRRASLIFPPCIPGTVHLSLGCIPVSGTGSGPGPSPGFSSRGGQKPKRGANNQKGGAHF